MKARALLVTGDKEAVDMIAEVVADTMAVDILVAGEVADKVADTMVVEEAVDRTAADHQQLPACS